MSTSRSRLARFIEELEYVRFLTFVFRCIDSCGIFLVESKARHTNQRNTGGIVGAPGQRLLAQERCIPVLNSCFKSANR